MSHPNLPVCPCGGVLASVRDGSHRCTRCGKLWLPPKEDRRRKSAEGRKAKKDKAPKPPATGDRKSPPPPPKSKGQRDSQLDVAEQDAVSQEEAYWAEDGPLCPGGA